MSLPLPPIRDFEQGQIVNMSFLPFFVTIPINPISGGPWRCLRKAGEGGGINTPLCVLTVYKVGGLIIYRVYKINMYSVMQSDGNSWEIDNFQETATSERMIPS